MKKLLVLIAVVTFGASAVSAQNLGLGVRVGSGFQAVGQKSFANDNYAELRLGMDWMHGAIIADFSALYVWDVARFGGDFFFDAGLGLNIGGRNHYVTVGAQLMAKVGYSIPGSPIDIAFDWSPVFGAEIIPGQNIGGGVKIKSISNFNERGIGNFGLSCVYKF